MKPDFSDYIIAVLLELDDGLPHSMDQCVDGVYDKCDIEYEIPLIGHYLKKEDVYYTSVKTAIVMLEANGILTIDNDHNLKSATTRLYDTEAKIICIVSKKGAQCIECHHKDI